MHAAGPKNPLHGITLQMIVTQLVEHYGWEMLGRMVPINCFNWQPSIKSSLVFLRRTPWAREKVEALYLDSLPDMQPQASDQTDPLQEEEQVVPPPTLD
jgi:uncharacterized protein (DUF2132 family)